MILQPGLAHQKFPDLYNAKQYVEKAHNLFKDPLGLAVGFHGADHFTAGFRSLVTGQHHDTLTCETLQKTGMSPGTARFIDNGISMATTAAGTAAIAQVGPATIRTVNSTSYIAPKGGVGNTAGSNGFLGRSGWELKNTSYQPIRNASTEIYRRSYSSHALDQMQNRGLMPSIIEDTIKNGYMTCGKKSGTIAYYGQSNNISVIIDAESGRVITTGFGKIRQ